MCNTDQGSYSVFSQENIRHEQQKQNKHKAEKIEKVSSPGNKVKKVLNGIGSVDLGVGRNKKIQAMKMTGEIIADHQMK